MNIVSKALRQAKDEFLMGLVAGVEKRLIIEYLTS
jgi:hypothetical protein